MTASPHGQATAGGVCGGNAAEASQRARAALLQDVARVFASVYLAVHGIVKVVLIIAVLRRRLWAYPAMLVVLLVFIAYQVYRLTYRMPIGMIALTIFDAFVIWLVWREYRYLRVPNRRAG